MMTSRVHGSAPGAAVRRTKKANAVLFFMD